VARAHGLQTDLWRRWVRQMRNPGRERLWNAGSTGQAEVALRTLGVRAQPFGCLGRSLRGRRPWTCTRRRSAGPARISTANIAIRRATRLRPRQPSSARSMPSAGRYGRHSEPPPLKGSARSTKRCSPSLISGRTSHARRRSATHARGRVDEAEADDALRSARCGTRLRCRFGARPTPETGVPFPDPRTRHGSASRTPGAKLQRSCR
jgi:hypothetical protein